MLDEFDRRAEQEGIATDTLKKYRIGRTVKRKQTPNNNGSIVRKPARQAKPKLVKHKILVFSLGN